MIEFLLHILVLSGIYIILALSLNLIVGYTGMVSLGHAAFFCVGAYVSSLLSLILGFSPWIGFFIGGFVGGIFGILISFPALRLKGDYLALGTFGFGVIVYSIVKNWISVTRGPMGLPGIPRLHLLSFSLSTVWSYLLLIIIIVLISVCIFKRISASPFGRVLISIREDEIASKFLGKNTAKYKLIVFVIGAFFAGIAGSLYAHYITFIDPSSFSVMESIIILLMVIFGGMGSISGPVLGAIILVAFPEFLRLVGMPSSIAAQVRQMLFGLLLIILVVWKPRGLLGKFRLS